MVDKINPKTPLDNHQLHLRLMPQSNCYHIHNHDNLFVDFGLFSLFTCWCSGLTSFIMLVFVLLLFNDRTMEDNWCKQVSTDWKPSIFLSPNKALTHPPYLILYRPNNGSLRNGCTMSFMWDAVKQMQCSSLWWMKPVARTRHTCAHSKTHFSAQLANKAIAQPLYKLTRCYHNITICSHVW